MEKDELEMDEMRMENHDKTNAALLKLYVEPPLYLPSVEKSKSFEVSYRTFLR